MVAGYSQTPLAKKLGVYGHSRICILGDDAAWLLEELPDQVKASRRLSRSGSDVVVLFCKDCASLARRIDPAARAIFPSGSLWVAWPRKAAGHISDLNENEIRAQVLARGLVDVKVAALCDDWSGLKLVWRKELRSLPQ